MGIRKDSVSEKIYQDNLPKGWIKIEFKKIIKNIPITNKKLKQKEYQEKGILPVIDQGQKFIGGFTDKIKLKVNCDLPVIIFGDHTKTIKFLNQEFVAGADGIKILKPKTTLNTKLIYFFIQAISLPDKGYARHYQYLTKSIISIPPLNEQKRIVTKIESIFAQIDATRVQLESIVNLLKQHKQSVLKQAFEGKLIPQDPNDESYEILLRKNYKDLVFEKNDDLPNGWVRTKINDICKLIGGGTPSRVNLEYFNGNIIWLTPTEISKNNIVKVFDSREKITELGLKKSSAKIIPQSSVMLTSRASIGYVAIAGTSVTTNQGFASFVCSDVIYNFYLAYWLIAKKNILKKQATGTTFKEITKSKLKLLDISLPPLNEQKCIVTKIESIFAEIDSIDKFVNEALKSLTIMKQSVLKQAFEGKLVPQDPNDEPASILLEKIQKEKSKK